MNSILFYFFLYINVNISGILYMYGFCNCVGFKVVDKGCCGIGRIVLVVLCNKFIFFMCLDLLIYVFFDFYYLIEKVY